MRRTALIMTTVVLLLTPAALAVAGGKVVDREQVSIVKKAEAAATSTGDVRASATTPVGDSAFRLHGRNRYETAADISRFFWEPEDVVTVNLATGENWPDGLTLGASSGGMGPTLLVTKNSLPTPTRNELQRLQPCWIIAAGSTGVISDGVLREASRYAEPELCPEP